jgi:NDP-sugar pyrophosphorylase family protein
MYAFDSSVLDEIVGPSPQDVGRDLLPRLVGHAQTVTVDGYFRDIGTLDAYRVAQKEWAVRDER